MLSRSGFPSGRRFRLLTEPASLKRGVRAYLLVDGFGFRLLTEPASLKRLARDYAIAGVIRVSGSSQSRPH